MISLGFEGDLDNHEDPRDIEDKFERVKYYFPFYRTDIDHFYEKLKQMSTDEMNMIDIKTSLIHVNTIKKVVKKSPAWKQMWGSLEILLRSFIFKEVVSDYKIETLNYKLKNKDWSDYTSVIELGSLGLLWCDGT